MTESAAIDTLAPRRDELTSRSIPQCLGVGIRANELLASGSQVHPSSDVRLEAIVGELVTALRSLVLGDPKSAELSVDRAAEMIDYCRSAEITNATAGCPKPERMLAVRGGLAPWQIRRVIAHIEGHLDGPVTTLDLAAVAKVSTYHFSRAFRQSLGETPHEYVMRRRVERAQGLMLTTGVSLGSIAIECGFADQAHFNKLFRRFAGQSPGAWRRARVMPLLDGDIHARPVKMGVCK